MTEQEQIRQLVVEVVRLKSDLEAARAERDRYEEVVRLFADFAHADECPSAHEVLDDNCECCVLIARQALSPAANEGGKSE
jgi:hypothetical protein